MVFLTITPSIIEGLKAWRDIPHSDPKDLQPSESDPPLNDAGVGSPISHGQVIDLWRALQDGGRKEYSLEGLLKGSCVYVPPPPPKPEPSDDFKALMARLRRDEEERAYERMTNPLSPLETFAQRFPGRGGMAQSFAEVNRPLQKADLGDDDVTYDDVHRQLMLIVNFLASILGVAATLWILARWWPTPARLFLTLAGSTLVGIAEVAVYSGYIWHLGEATKKEKTLKEVKKVVNTWVVGEDGVEEKESIPVDEKEPKETSSQAAKKGAKPTRKIGRCI